VKFTHAIDEYIADAKREGRLNSPHSINAYETKLNLLAEDVSNRDPSKVGAKDIKRWLDRWPRPTTAAVTGGSHTSAAVRACARRSCEACRAGTSRAPASSGSRRIWEKD
jgi:hypothetical protein